jgi:hypothetical protein
LLQNRFGAGQAFLLNHFLNGYPEDKREGRNQKTLEQMKGLLQTAGISPKVRLTSLEGEPVSDCATYLFTSGSTQLYGLVPDKSKLGNQRVRISLAEEKSIYDVRGKRFVATGSSFVEEIEPAIPRLFAFVSGRASGLELETPSTARLGAEVVISFRVRHIDDYRSVATVEVTDPEGNKFPYYGGNADIIDNAGFLRFRTALNDAMGPWRVTVTDTITGITGETTVLIEGGQ